MLRRNDQREIFAPEIAGDTSDAFTNKKAVLGSALHFERKDGTVAVRKPFTSAPAAQASNPATAFISTFDQQTTKSSNGYFHYSARAP